MRKLRFFWLLLMVSLLAAACTGEEKAAPQTPEGPALIMFYTDG